MSYNPHTWYTGEIVQADNLNHIENGIQNLDEAVENLTLSASSAKRTVNLHNVDRVISFGSSQTESHYSLPNKDWTSKLSLFTDYNFEQFAVSGDTTRGQLYKLRKKQNHYSGTTGQGQAPEDCNPTYILITTRANDIKYTTEEQVLNDFKSLIETCARMGASPILGTRYISDGNNGLAALFEDLAREYNGYWYENYTNYMLNTGTNYAPFWNGTHSGTRTNTYMTDIVVKLFNEVIPKPFQSIKLFSPRSTVDTSNLDNLLYFNNIERAEKFMELPIANTHISNYAYYDAIPSNPANQKSPSKYLALMNNQAVTFGKYAVCDVIFPSDAYNLTQVDINITSNKNLKYYIIDALAEPYPAPVWVRRFDIPQILTEGTDFVIGNKYTNSLDNKTYTLLQVLFQPVESSSGTVNGTIFLCSGNQGSSATEAGTLTKTQGTGLNSLNYYYSAVGSTDDYPAGKLSIGHWKEIVGNSIFQEDLIKSMNVDKLSILIESPDEDFTMTDISFDYYGDVIKSKIHKVIQHSLPRENLTELSLTKKTTDAVITLADNCYPRNNHNIYNLTSASSIVYGATGINTYCVGGSCRLKLRVQARWFPEIFDPSNTFGVDSPITLDSFDFKKIKIRVRFNGNNSDSASTLISAKNYLQFEKLVPLYWSSIDIPLFGYLGQDFISVELINEDTDNPIQIGSVNLYKVD